MLISGKKKLIRNIVNIPRSGLIGEWLFSGNANDTSGSGYDGTVTNATLTTDRNGAANSAYNFDTTAYISLGDVLDMGTASFSISVWANPSSTSTLITFFSKTDNAGSASTYFFGTDSTGKVRAFIRGTSGGILVCTNNTITTGWKHYCVLFNKSGNIQVYIDDVLQAVETTITSIAGQNMDNAFDCRIGGTSGGAGLFSGDLDDIRVYNRILTTSEISILANE